MATAIEATFVQWNTGPDIAAQLHKADDPATVVSLVGCTVRFQMRKPDDRRFTVDAPADITSESLGLVSYSWGARDLATDGEYDAQWEVTFPDGKVQTQAVANRILVRRK